MRAPRGLFGRVLAILLLTMVLEFGVSTLLYERASHFSIQDDEARRLAEHLVISGKLLSERPPEQRATMAGSLTTSRYIIAWSAVRPPANRLAPSLDRMYRQVIGWEPGLANAELRIHLASPGRNAVTTGVMQLPDKSWVYFSTRDAIHQPNLVGERVLLAMFPAIGLLLIGGLLMRQTLQPLRDLAQAADKVGISEDNEVPEAGPAEVRRVISAFNRMHARIGALIEDRTQALAAVGHDMRTPLARLRLRADGIPDSSLRESIEGDVSEMEAMVSSLLAYLGGENEEEAPVATDLAVLCETVCDDLVDHGHDALYMGPAHCDVWVRRGILKRAIVNLTENALHYGDKVIVTLSRCADGVAIAVEDNGPGVPEDQLAHIRQPFVRLDTARARDTIGLGLGLAIVEGAVAKHGGTLTLENRAEGGFRAKIFLPTGASKVSLH